MYKQIEDIKSAISMTDFGISTVVITTHKNLMEILHEYATKPDHVWCYGRGKLHLHAKLKKELIQEDQFFNDHPQFAVHGNERWNNFCDDCVLLYVLDAFLFNKPLVLMHPESYVKGLSNASVIATNGNVPDFVPQIPVIQ